MIKKNCKFNDGNNGYLPVGHRVFWMNQRQYSSLSTGTFRYLQLFDHLTEYQYQQLKTTNCQVRLADMSVFLINSFTGMALWGEPPKRGPILGRP